MYNVTARLCVTPMYILATNGVGRLYQFLISGNTIQQYQSIVCVRVQWRHELGGTYTTQVPDADCSMKKPQPTASGNQKDKCWANCPIEFTRKV